MAYVIMNHNAVEGFLIGAFRSLTQLYLEDWIGEGDGEERVVRAKWCTNISKAKMFDSEQDAWRAVFEIWGLWFSTRHHMVVSVHEQLLTNAEERADRYKK